MTTIVSKFNQSLFDMCLQCYGSLSYMDNILSDNTSLTYDSEIEVGQEIEYNEAIGVLKINDKRDIEKISFSNGPVFRDYVLGTHDDEFIQTDDGLYIGINI